MIILVQPINLAPSVEVTGQVGGNKGPNSQRIINLANGYWYNFILDTRELVRHTRWYVSYECRVMNQNNVVPAWPIVIIVNKGNFDTDDKLYTQEPEP